MRRPAAMLVVFAGLALILATSSSAARSGLRGLVVFSPSRPVCIDDESCTRPAARVVLAFSRNGRVVARVRTDADGRYRVRLPAGVFRVTAPGYRVGTGVTPPKVGVREGLMRRVDLQIDTGIQ